MSDSNIEITYITPPSSASEEIKAEILALYMNERDTWPNPSMVKIENALKHALALGIVYYQPEGDATATTASSGETHEAKAVSTASTSKKLGGFILMTGAPNDPLLEDMIIAPSLRGKGLGVRLIKTTLEMEPFKSAPRVDLYCKGFLIPFYEKAGFSVVRRGDTPNDKGLMRIQR